MARRTSGGHANESQLDGEESSIGGSNVSKRRKKVASRQLPPRPALRPEIAVPTPPAPTPGPGQRTFNPDYSYIVKDLKRIGILAAGFITILVILSFFLG
jgi:hypothetical protein